MSLVKLSILCICIQKGKQIKKPHYCNGWKTRRCMALQASTTHSASHGGCSELLCSRSVRQLEKYSDPLEWHQRAETSDRHLSASDNARARRQEYLSISIPLLIIPIWKIVWSYSRYSIQTYSYQEYNYLITTRLQQPSCADVYQGHLRCSWHWHQLN